MKKTILLISLIILFFSVNVFCYVWEGFESINMWLKFIKEGNALQSMDISSAEATEGKNALELQVDLKKETDQAVINYIGIFDLSKISRIKFDAYAEEPADITLGLITGKNFTLYESKPYPLKKRWNRNITLNLDKSQWKSEKKKWEPADKPDNLDETKKIIITIMNSKAKKIYLDNIRFDGKKVPNPAENVPYEKYTDEKLKDEYSLLNEINTPDWSNKTYNPGTTKQNGKHVLPYKNVDNENKAVYQAELDMDLREYCQLIMKIKNTGKKVCTLAIAIQTGEKWDWFESPQFLLEANNFTEVKLNLNAPYFKTKETSWNHISPLYNKDQIKTINFLVYGLDQDKREGEVIIEKFQLLKGKIYLPSKNEK